MIRTVKYLVWIDENIQCGYYSLPSYNQRNLTDNGKYLLLFKMLTSEGLKTQ